MAGNQELCNSQVSYCTVHIANRKMATVSRQSTGSKSQAFRVLYDKGQDPNVEITSLLQKRQHNIKGKTSLKKKQRTHDVSITGKQSNTKSSRLNEQLAKQNEQMSLRHAREVQQIHQFYTSQISSLQANWEVERAQFQETIEILEQQLEEVSTRKSATRDHAPKHFFQEKEENSRIVEELETALDESENYNHNLSLLYKVSCMNPLPTARWRTSINSLGLFIIYVDCSTNRRGRTTGAKETKHSFPPSHGNGTVLSVSNQFYFATIDLFSRIVPFFLLVMDSDFGLSYFARGGAHRGVTCDSCEAQDFSGSRFK